VARVKCPFVYNVLTFLDSFITQHFVFHVFSYFQEMKYVIFYSKQREHLIVKATLNQDIKTVSN
jgi:hypothetical protein